MALTETTEFTESKRWFYFFRGTEKMKPIFSSVISVRSSDPDSSERSGERVRKEFTNRGFTLIEILVALIIVTVTVSVVLGSQLVSLKIEQKARALQLFRFETQRIFSATHRAQNEQELMQLLATNSLGRVKSEKIQIESGTNVLTFIKHELHADPSARASATAEDLPSSSLRSQGLCYGGVGFSSVFYTRFPDYPGRRPDAGKHPVKE